MSDCAQRGPPLTHVLILPLPFSSSPRSYPFPYYVVVAGNASAALPEVLGDALRQWIAETSGSE